MNVHIVKSVTVTMIDNKYIKPRHTKEVLKMVQVVPLFSTQHLHMY